MATPIPKNRLERTSAEIARAASGTLLRGDALRSHVGITTDSREATPGSMFVALRGERFDGHDFVSNAARTGATLLLAERGRVAARALPAVDVVEVEDTLAAWGALARDHLVRWRRRTNGRVAAITGSAGKTTTKSLLTALVEVAGADVGATYATAGNLNNRIGLPATVFALEASHRFVVLEMGTNLPGEIAALAAIAVPDVAILTNVGLAHAERLGGTRAGVGHEKGALFEALPEAGCAVVNADDDEVERQVSRSRARHIVRFGRAPHAHYRLLERTSPTAEGSRLVLRSPGGEIAVDFPLPGEAAALDFLAALAAAEYVVGRALAQGELVRALGHVSPGAGRAQVHRLASGATLIDDSYNANPASMAAAIELAAELARPEARRTVAILGEMRELGSASTEAHIALGDQLGRAGVRMAIGCGGAIDAALERAAGAGVQVLHAASTDEAAELALAHIRPGDVILVKGSRGVRTERIALALLAADGAGTLGGAAST